MENNKLSSWLFSFKLWFSLFVSMLSLKAMLDWFLLKIMGPDCYLSKGKSPFHAHSILDNSHAYTIAYCYLSISNTFLQHLALAERI